MSFENGLTSQQNRAEALDRGREVFVIVKIIRHGERTKEGELTSYGEEIILQKANEVELPELLGVKSLGSALKPLGSLDEPRALKTARIYAEELLRLGKVKKQYKTRSKLLLNPENLESEAPFDWTNFYNSNLPNSFEDLSDSEKAKASYIAQTKAVERVLISGDTIEYKKEVAGSFAAFLIKYIKSVERLKGGSKILYIAGSHGGIMEPFLQECLIRKKDGVIKYGFKNLEEFGGAFKTAEAFNVVIQTDGNGKKTISVNFDDTNRLSGESWTLDTHKMEYLMREYMKKHSDS